MLEFKLNENSVSAKCFLNTYLLFILEGHFVGMRTEDLVTLHSILFVMYFFLLLLLLDFTQDDQLTCTSWKIKFILLCAISHSAWEFRQS